MKIIYNYLFIHKGVIVHRIYGIDGLDIFSKPLLEHTQCTWMNYCKDGSLTNSRKPQEAPKEPKTFYPITARGTLQNVDV